MELEVQAEVPKKPLFKQRNCLIFMAGSAVLLIILLILIFTVFKIEDPEIKLVSTTVSGIVPRVTNPNLRLQVELNITLDIKIEVHNPNYFSFKLGEGTSQVYFHSDQVADVDILPGHIGSKSSDMLECRLILEADKFNMTSLIRDVFSGELDIEMRAKLPGRVTILGFIKKHVVASTDCQLGIQVPSLNLTKQDCHQKVKL
ncbi:hypothetical protein AQUCO_00300015v1 [Aquilegia coerulea]|uniref:Late embryogenesis abundant protein LEA-2 subgroup domain-containing protein n=1 Tax=Aquilegia coerulea TaxID=218851 RepID=A0A2G5EWU4_AQUCA|nr:hypothetical protein AQUCO_00300015v1 [Aquilegia coerulea]